MSINGLKTGVNAAGGINVSYAVIDSPVGKLTISSDGENITGAAFGDISGGSGYGAVDVPVLCQCIDELAEYFAGRLTQFSVPIKPAGTPFRMRVWEELRRIPYGETISYKQLAERAGNVKAIRAAGGANHHNPIVIIIPCHRVIGSDGSLTGFGGGIENKSLLLELELTTARRLGKINSAVEGKGL